MPQALSVCYLDPWAAEFDPRTWLFSQRLAALFDLSVSGEKEAGFAVCAGVSNQHLSFMGPRLIASGENLVPDFCRYDYGIGFHHLEFGDRYLRFPYYAWRQATFAAARDKHTAFDGIRRPKFCNFVVSNNWCADPIREEAFSKLSAYKPVDAGGKLRNNIGGAVRDKLAFQRQYRFSLAFENSSVPGYVTEKIIDAWAAQTIPIYWGDPGIVREFNPEAFINCHDYDSFDAVIKRIEQIENDEAQYQRIMRAPILLADSLGNRYTVAYLDQYLLHVFSQPPPYAMRRATYGMSLWMERRAAHLAKYDEAEKALKRAIRRIVPKK